jgi:hypothetical protein
MEDESHRAAVDAAYARLRETLEAKDVSVHGLKEAALEALNTARVQVEMDPNGTTAEVREPDAAPESISEPDPQHKSNANQL